MLDGALSSLTLITFPSSWLGQVREAGGSGGRGGPEAPPEVSWGQLGELRKTRMSGDVGSLVTTWYSPLLFVNSCIALVYIVDFTGGSFTWSRQCESDGQESSKTVQVISQMLSKYLYVEEEYLYVSSFSFNELCSILRQIHISTTMQCQYNVQCQYNNAMSNKYLYVEEEYLYVWNWN